MDPTAKKQDMDVSGVDTDNPASYLKALFGDYSAWNKEILFPDLDQEYCEVEGTPFDVSYASTVDNESEVGKTGHVMHTSQSGSDEDTHKSVNQTYPFTPSEVPEPSKMDHAYVTQHETERHCGTGANDPEAMDVYSSQGSVTTTNGPLPTNDASLSTNCVPLPTTNAPLPTTNPALSTNIVLLPTTISPVPDLDDLLPLLSDEMGTPESLAMQLNENPVQAPRPLLQNTGQLPTSFTDGAQDVQDAAGTPVQGAVPFQPDLSHTDLACVLQWIQGFEPMYQLNPTSGAATAGVIPGIPEGNIPQLSESLATDSIMDPGSTIVGSTTSPITNPSTEQSVVMGTPISSSELSDILNILSGSTSNSADTHVMSSQMTVDPDMGLPAEVLHQQHTDQSSHLGDIPSPEPEVMSATTVAANGAPTTASVKKGLKSKIQLKRLQRGEKELTVSFVGKPSGELTEDEKEKIDLRKQRNKESANRSRLNRQMKMEKQMQENAEAEKELEMLKSEVEKTRQVRDVLQYWWDRRLCHVTTGFRKPPYHMGVNDLLDALEKYLASEDKV